MHAVLFRTAKQPNMGNEPINLYKELNPSGRLLLNVKSDAGLLLWQFDLEGDEEEENEKKKERKHSQMRLNIMLQLR